MQVDHSGVVSAPARTGVIERATAVMDAFVEGPEWMGLDDISALAVIPRSTTFRILRQLVDLHWLDHDERGYRLGARVRRYGARVTDGEDLRAAANAALTELNLATGGVAHLGVLDGTNVNYLDRVGGRASASIPSRIGVRIPVTDTVCGQVFLASLTPEQADAVIGRATERGRDSPPSSTRSRAHLHRDLQRVRHRNGVAFLPADRCHLGITAIAAPISGPSGTVAAVSVSVRRPVEFQRLAPLIVHAARRTTQMLSAQHRMAG